MLPNDAIDVDNGRSGLPRAESDPSDSPISALLASPRQFVTAGKAIFTLVGLSDRYTYKVTHKPASGQYGDTYFVSLLTGPENTTDYTYLGILDSQTGQVRLTKASSYTDESKPVKALRWALRRLWAGQSIEPATILHAGRCGRCGRLLTVPESIASGYGPECLGRL